MQYCGDCKRETHSILDHSSGDTICTACGLVLDAWHIDETAEYRVFEDSNENPERVGAASNPLLSGGNLYTCISNDAGGVGKITSLRSVHGVGAEERSLENGFKGMANIADRLGLPPQTLFAAQELFKNVKEKLKTLKGQSLEAYLAACLHQAGKNQCTLKEVQAACPGMKLKDLSKAIGNLSKMELHVPSQTSTEDANANVWSSQKYVKYFSNLGVGNQAFRLANIAAKAQETVVKKLDIRRTPLTISASIAYMVLQREGFPQVLAQEVGNAFQVAEATIRFTAKELQEHVNFIFPEKKSK